MLPNVTQSFKLRRPNFESYRAEAMLRLFIAEYCSTAVLANQWVATHWWVAKLFQVGREAFLNVTVFY